MRRTVILASIFLIFIIARRAIGFTVDTTQRLTKSTFEVVSKRFGTPLIKDDYGHINTLIVGVAGHNYRGWTLTDTLMLASFDPKLWTVTFLSIPRDLYVSFGRGATERINAIYPAMYLDSGEDHEVAIKALMDKVSEITGVPISYYAMVDFDGFVSFIDQLGGIEVNVREPIYDDQYPWPNNSYVVLNINAGPQTFDGATALKYARSRKSTSDFSRSLRRQVIIQATIDKIKSSISLTNVAEVKSIYQKAMDIFITNISVDNILRLVQFIEKKPDFFSYVYESDCSIQNYKYTTPACVLYYGDRESFGGASVVIPQGASATKLDYYEKTQDVAHRLIYRQDVLREHTPIVIQNGIDKQRAKSQGYSVNGVADDTAIQLKLRWFDVEDVINAQTPQEQTILYTDDESAYPETIDALAAFISYDSVVQTGTYGSGVTVILGNDRLKRL